jgi:hypothetical protein
VDFREAVPVAIQGMQPGIANQVTPIIASPTLNIEPLLRNDPDTILPESAAPLPEPPILRFTEHRSTFLYREPSESARRRLQETAEQLRDLRALHGCSRRELAALLEIDIEVIVAAENAMGSLLNASSVLHKAQSVLQR